MILPSSSLYFFFLASVCSSLISISTNINIAHLLLLAAIPQPCCGSTAVDLPPCDGVVMCLMFNARSESFAEKASFRRLLPKNRCLVAVEGFYEWKKDGSKKQPYYIHFKDGRPLVFAALYDSWQNSEGIEFVSTDEGIFLHQSKYATDILKRFEMCDSNPVSTPVDMSNKLAREGDENEVDSTLYKQMVGSLRYLCNSRLDIAFGVRLISRFMEKPRMSHLIAAKRLLRYIKGTHYYGILYPKQENCVGIGEILGYTDSDWSGDRSDRKSTGGYVFMYEKAPFSWCSKKQNVVALSSCEAEYIAASFAACQASWLSMLLSEMNIHQDNAMRLLIDNRSAIDLAKNPVAHGHSKHIDTRYHFLRDQVNKEKLQLTH